MSIVDNNLLADQTRQVERTLPCLSVAEHRIYYRAHNRLLTFLVGAQGRMAAREKWRIRRDDAWCSTGLNVNPLVKRMV